MTTQRQPEPSAAAPARPMSSVWGPGYQSVICHGTPPGERGCRNSALLSANASQSRQRCAADGRGWGNGTVPGLTKPDKRPPQGRHQAAAASAAAAAAQGITRRKAGVSGNSFNRDTSAGRVRPFRWVLHQGMPGAAQRVYLHMLTLPAGTAMTDQAIGDYVRRSPAQARVLLRDATNAGVFVVTRRGDVHHYRLGPTVPTNAGLPA